jgi:uncharacterized membrane protein
LYAISKQDFAVSQDVWVRLVVAGVEVCASGGSATAIRLGLNSGGQIIVPSSVFFPSLAATVGVTKLGRDAFQNTRIASITIPRHVQILCSECFSHCNSLSSISFGTDSELTHIKSTVFFFCSSLKSITIPRHVHFIDGSTFSNVSKISISIASDNSYFGVKSYFILDSSKTKLIHYFGDESHIIIPRHVQILCSECFSYCNSLSSISFETDSELTHIESTIFYFCSSLKSITIPRHVQILCSECFSHCNSLSSISFETDSVLTRIEAGAFAATRLSLVVVPGSVSFIAVDAFPAGCVVALAGGDSNAAFREWVRRHQSGWSEVFERRI